MIILSFLDGIAQVMINGEIYYINKKGERVKKINVLLSNQRNTTDIE